ncbi:MAG: serine/threonine-protein kinase [Pseudomonadota bacterium]
MSRLENSLQEFAAGNLEYDDLTSTVSDLARDEPARAIDLMAVISGAYEAGVLDGPQCSELLSKVLSAEAIDVTGASGTFDPEQTQTFFLAAESADAREVGPGSIIKRRFHLEERLGEGGMGVVYKARDAIKVEARDRDPYVAVKVLNEDFKNHPESFIALQRECSKAQKLAHPNIATVFDFDRTGGMAFMTMEWLRGQPLNDYLATELPDEGLSLEESLPIVEGLAAALAHAHKNHIVHSDFKPGNAFICDNGIVKVLDFGIARAITQPGQDSTTFDPGALGALTPTYASPEMLEGLAPDPRDDIYALAVVTYILLASEHPYDRYPANMAKAMKLKPAPLAKLSRAENAALEQALHLERDSRTQRAETFLSDLKGEHETEVKLQQQSRLLMILASALVVMSACVVYLLLR